MELNFSFQLSLLGGSLSSLILSRTKFWDGREKRRSLFKSVKQSIWVRGLWFFLRCCNPTLVLICLKHYTLQHPSRKYYQRMQGKRKRKLKETCIEVSLYLLTYTGNIRLESHRNQFEEPSLSDRASFFFLNGLA